MKYIIFYGVKEKKFESSQYDNAKVFYEKQLKMNLEKGLTLIEHPIHAWTIDGQKRIQGLHKLGSKYDTRRI
jgi:hypothetical protein